MTSRSEQLANDLHDVQNSKDKSASHVFDDLIALQQQSKTGDLKKDLQDATVALQKSGHLPDFAISSVGEALGAAGEQVSNKVVKDIQAGHLFSAVGDMLGNEAGPEVQNVTKNGDTTIHYPDGRSVQIDRDSSGNLSKLTWNDGSTWTRQPDGTYTIADSKGNQTGEINGTVSLDASNNTIEVQNSDKSGYNIKTDGTKVVHDAQNNVTEIDYDNGTSRKFAYDGKGQIDQVTETNGNTWVRDDKGVFHEFDQQGKPTNRTNDATPTVGADGTYQVMNNKDKSIDLNYTDGSRLHYDNNGNVTEYQYPDGSTVDYHYTNGLVDQVKDRDGTDWRRDNTGLFHQYDASGNETGATATGTKFIPPTTDTNLYENEKSGLFDRLVGALGGVGGVSGKPGGTGMDSPVNPNDVDQGSLGDCYFLSAVADVAAKDPSAIQRMIHDNQDGTYTVTFPGEPDKPITVEAPTQDELNRFAHENDGTYVAVLEKAHRYLTGKTDNDNGGDPSEGLQLMTGDKYKDWNMHQSEPGFFPWEWGNQTTDKEVAQELTNALNNNQEVTAGTSDSNGPIHDHAWSVLGYDPKSETVTIRNPWGELGFDPSKYPSVHDLGNGEFTMSLQEFHQQFEYLSVQQS